MYLCDGEEDGRRKAEDDDESLLIPNTGNELKDKSVQEYNEYSLMEEDTECTAKTHNKEGEEQDRAICKEKESLEINDNCDVPLGREERSVHRHKIECTAVCDILRLFHWSMYLYSLPCLLYYVAMGLYPLPTALSVMSCVIAVEIAVILIRKI